MHELLLSRRRRIPVSLVPLGDEVNLRLVGLARRGQAGGGHHAASLLEHVVRALLRARLLVLERRGFAHLLGELLLGEASHGDLLAANGLLPLRKRLEWHRLARHRARLLLHHHVLHACAHVGHVVLPVVLLALRTHLAELVLQRVLLHLLTGVRAVRTVELRLAVLRVLVAQALSRHLLLHFERLVVLRMLHESGLAFLGQVARVIQSGGDLLALRRGGVLGGLELPRVALPR